MSIDSKASKASEKKTEKSDKKTKSTSAVTKKKTSPAKFIKDLKSELKKVVWPSRKQVLNNTGIVLTVMVIVGLFLAGIDSGLGFIVEKLLNLG